MFNVGNSFNAVFLLVPTLAIGDAAQSENGIMLNVTHKIALKFTQVVNFILLSCLNAKKNGLQFEIIRLY